MWLSSGHGHVKLSLEGMVALVQVVSKLQHSTDTRVPQMLTCKVRPPDASLIIESFHTAAHQHSNPFRRYYGCPPAIEESDWVRYVFN